MSKATDILSLEEILMEGTTDTLKDRHSKMDRLRANVQQVRVYCQLVPNCASKIRVVICDF